MLYYVHDFVSVETIPERATRLLHNGSIWQPKVSDLDGWCSLPPPLIMLIHLFYYYPHNNLKPLIKRGWVPFSFVRSTTHYILFSSTLLYPLWSSNFPLLSLPLSLLPLFLLNKKTATVIPLIPNAFQAVVCIMYKMSSILCMHANGLPNE